MPTVITLFWNKAHLGLKRFAAEVGGYALQQLCGDAELDASASAKAVVGLAAAALLAQRIAGAVARGLCTCVLAAMVSLRALHSCYLVHCKDAVQLPWCAAPMLA